MKLSGADSWWTVQMDMEEASTVILGVSRDGCVYYVLSSPLDELRSSLRWFSLQKLMDMRNLFYLVGSMVFYGFYYFRTSVADRSSQLRCPSTVADMVTHDLLWIRGSYLCRFSVDDGSA
jgi:hypothetical protein